MLALLFACAPGPMLDQQYRELPGVQSVLLSLDLYPAGEDAPVLVWVHGGAWREGDKKKDIEDKRRLAKESGYSLASLNYRLSDPEDFGEAGHVLHPAHVEDIAAALAWLHRQAASLGICGDHFVLLGPSAGAHLVALVASDTKYLEAEGFDPAFLRGVGSYDVDAYDLYTRIRSSPDPLYINAFGEDPATWEDASPIFHLRPDLPPFQLACRGPDRRQRYCHSFEAALQEEGAEVDVVDATPLKHPDVADSIGEEGSLMTEAVAAFLERCR